MGNNEGLERQRRNLFSISISIIIFYMLGASFLDKGSLFFGAITYAKGGGDYLLYTLWLGLLYFSWRYWIYGGNKAYSLYRGTFLNYLREDVVFQNYLKKKFMPEAVRNIIRQVNQSHSTYTKLYNSIKNHEIGFDISEDKTNKCYKIVINYVLYVEPNNLPKHYHKVYLTKLYVHPYFTLRSIFKTIFSNKQFGDYSLPLLISWLAFCCIAVDLTLRII